MHDEREFDRVLGIESVELIGINNRNLGILYQTYSCVCQCPNTSTEGSASSIVASNFCVVAETFELDISTTKKLLEGERGKIVRERNIMVGVQRIVIPF